MTDADIAFRDILRGRGLTEEQIDDVEKWARVPDAVKELIRHTPESGEHTSCPSCFVYLYEEAHDRSCRIVAAWRELGDPRADADLKAAEQEALMENMRRSGQWERARAILLGRPDVAV